jgi:hypothetical protein
MAGGMNAKTNDRSGLLMAMRAVMVRDVLFSIGLAAVVVTLTSVMGSI